MFQGSMVALVTPMREGGDIDEGSLQRLIDFHVENGSDALIAVGTTGESATLNEEEHCHLIQRTMEMAAGRIPIIAGLDAGHGNPNLTLPMGLEATLDADRHLLSYHRPATV